jgi:hypothetical protein
VKIEASSVAVPKPLIGEAPKSWAFTAAWNGLAILSIQSHRVRQTLGGLAAGFLIGSGVLRWNHDIHVMGLRTALANIGLMVRIRYRAPLRRKWLPSRHAVGIYDLVLLVLAVPWLILSRWPLPSALLALTSFLASRLDFVRTPEVLYLGASSAPNFSLFKLIQSNGPGLILSAIDHAHPDVMRGRPISRYAGPLAAYFQALPGYAGPQATTLRTREGEWERTVRELMDVAPLVVLDMQLPVPHVLRELSWIISSDYTYKTILVTTEDSIVASTLEGVGFCSVATGARACLHQLRQLTRNRATIPARPKPKSACSSPAVTLLEDALAHRRSDLRHVCDALARGDDHGPDLDRDIVRLFGTEQPSARLTTSLDRVLGLAADCRQPMSLSIHVDLDGRADCEVGRRINEAFVVIPSRKNMSAPPPRSLLAAIVASELYVNGEPTPDSVLTAERPLIVARRLPARQVRVAHVREPRLRERILSGTHRATAEALASDVRSSPASQALDDRLHDLFLVDPRPDTFGLTASANAAIAFARRVGIASSINVNVDGTAWAMIGGTDRGTHWRWETEQVELPPAEALTVAMLDLFR